MAEQKNENNEKKLRREEKIRSAVDGLIASAVGGKLSE